MARPLQFESLAHAGRAETVVAVELGQFVSQTHVAELFDASWCQPVTAGLLTRIRLSLDDRHGVTVAGEPVARRAARRATTDDQHVVMGRGHQISVPAEGKNNTVPA